MAIGYIQSKQFTMEVHETGYCSNHEFGCHSNAKTKNYFLKFIYFCLSQTINSVHGKFAQLELIKLSPMQATYGLPKVKRL